MAMINDPFVRTLAKDLCCKQVTVFLMNGFQRHGELSDVEDGGIILKDQKKSYIPWHAISTIQ